ncbi:MAG: BON domain-containing protein [Burkholderiaceae bacterium]|nr:BON domain-containing protein [Burkholderiaceae bacterium]MCZ8173711.1 BON domain-containing protein [Burkholderiaceae bacterium]
MTSSLLWRPVLVATLALLLSGCAPLLLGGAVVGGGLVATDRRTAGTQLEDQGIEFRAAARVRELATLGQISVNSYNRVVLLTGEVPNATERARVEDAVGKVENVRGVVNELVVAGNSSLSSRSADTVLATKVKATLVDAQDLSSNAFRVVAERRVIYLMGRVTPREAERAAELASRVSGVERVVKVFDLITEAQLAAETALLRGGAPAPAPAASAPAPAR